MPKKRRPPKHRQHYDDAEIALVYLVGKSARAKTLLARLLGRSEGAIDMVWRWVDHAGFPPEAYNRIKRQVERIERRLGARNKGKIRLR